MNAFTTLLRRELAAYFLSPIAYVMICFFLLVMGLSFCSMASFLWEGRASVSVMNALFGESIFFWIAMLVVVPLITMRLFSEEMRTGSIELLMTAPVTDTQVVLAKYFGALVFFILMWLPTVAYAFILKRFTPQDPIDLGPMMSAYAGAFLVGAFYIAVGLLTSALTRNQVVASMTCFAVIAIAFFSGFIPYYTQSEFFSKLGSFFSSVEHMIEFSRGVVDTRSVVLYLSLCAVILFAAVKVVESRKTK